MTRNEAFQEILSLTPDPSWMSDPARVERVQELGRFISGCMGKREKRIRKLIGVYRGDELLYEGNSKTLAALFGLSETTMNNRARNNYVDSEGRKFKYLRDKG